MTEITVLSVDFANKKTKKKLDFNVYIFRFIVIVIFWNISILHYISKHNVVCVYFYIIFLHIIVKTNFNFYIINLIIIFIHSYILMVIYTLNKLLRSLIWKFRFYFERNFFCTTNIDFFFSNIHFHWCEFK